MVVINNNITGYNKIEPKARTWYNWIPLTKECETCENRKDEKTCIINGVKRDIYTKGGMKPKCSAKIRIVNKKV